MKSNNTPHIDAYHIKSFKQWCKKVLPLVYDDSLSYYELLCKTVACLNKIIENNNYIVDDMTELNNAYTELQQFINDYLENADLPQMLEDKLDEMASDGTLSALVNSTLGFFITPEMFGAVGNGETDDTMALAKAFEVGGYVVLNNHYLITSALNIGGNTYVTGVGSITAACYLEKMITVEGDNVCFTVDLNGGGCAIHGITITNSSNVKVSDCELYNFKGAGVDINTNAITVLAGCDHVVVDRCVIHDIQPLEDGAGGNRVGSGQAVLFFKVTNCFVRNCVISKIHGLEDGDAIHVFAINEVSDVTIENCNFSFIFKRGIKLQCNGATVRNNRFSNISDENVDGIISCISVYGSDNIVEGNSFLLNKAYRVIEITDNDATDNIICGNKIVCDKNNEHVSVHGGIATFLFINGTNTVIKNNTFEGGRQIITLHVNSNNTVIADNVFISKKGYAVFSSVPCTNVTITNNLFECSGNTAITFSGGVTTLVIANNTCLNVGYFLNMYNDKTVTGVIKGNTFFGNLYDNVFRIEDSVVDKSGLIVDEKQCSKVFTSDVMPSGKFVKGDLCYNSNPTAGSPIGWVCVTSGTNSTWKAFGMIEE